MIQDFKKSWGKKERSTRCNLMIRWDKRHHKILWDLIKGHLQECQLRDLIKVLLHDLTKVSLLNLIRAHHQDLIKSPLQHLVKVLHQALTKVHPLVTIKAHLQASLSPLLFSTKFHPIKAHHPNLTKVHQEWIPIVEPHQTNLTSDDRKSKNINVI